MLSCSSQDDVRGMLIPNPRRNPVWRSEHLADDSETMRVIELFSGIGGMRAAWPTVGDERAFGAVRCSFCGGRRRPGEGGDGSVHDPHGSNVHDKRRVNASFLAVDVQGSATDTYTHNYDASARRLRRGERQGQPKTDNSQQQDIGRRGGGDNSQQQDIGRRGGGGKIKRMAERRERLVAEASSGTPTKPSCTETTTAATPPGDVIRQVLVQHLRPSFLDEYKADVWTMSPPCQPFTKVCNAKQNDMDDRRCDGLKYVCSLLDDVLMKPRYILLENVQAFSDSHMADVWRTTLTRNGYHFTEYSLSPCEFGIPNHRRRVFILARLLTDGDTVASSGVGSNDVRTGDDCGDVVGPRSADDLWKDLESLTRRCTCVASATNDDIENDHDDWTADPFSSLGWSVKRNTPTSDDDNGGNTAQWRHAIMAGCLPISTYMDSRGHHQALQLSDDLLSKAFAAKLSIVRPDSRETCCFTRAYARVLHRSSGSVFCESGTETGEDHEPREDTCDGSDDGDNSPASAIDPTKPSSYLSEEEMLRRYGGGRLRRFAPEELLNLFGFPTQKALQRTADHDDGDDSRLPFEFPPHLSTRHRYQLVGNSVSVIVVRAVLLVLLYSSSGSESTGARPRVVEPINE